MMNRSSPWQYEWKRPRWSTVKSNEGNPRSDVPGVPLSVTSAQLSPSERLFLGINRGDELVLSITLFNSFQHDQRGDVLLLELIQHTNESLTCIKDRILHWPGLTMTKQSVLSIALSRRPPPQVSTTAIDALDVINRMSLGGLTSIKPQYETSVAKQLIAEQHEALILSCLTTDGQVYFYEPLNFLKADKEIEDKIGMGLADLLLGVTLHRHIKESIFPLSQPFALTSLSVSLHNTAKPADTTLSDESRVRMIASKMKESPNAKKVWDATMWDANVEPSSTIYRTVDNQAFLVEPVFEYLAVVGRGRKVNRSVRVLSKKVESMSTLSQDDTERAEDGNHESKHEYLEIGGFITFLSMTHFSETRTVYLPFSPKAVYPVTWGEMYFVLVLEEAGPRTIAIRVDSNQLYSVPCGRFPVVHEENTRETEILPMCPIIRFHSIPVVLPVEDQLSLTTVQTKAASSVQTTPPSIALMHASRNSSLADVAISLHTLDSFDLADGFHNTKGVLSVVIRTKEKSGHTARIPKQVPASALKHSWCRIGQGWSFMGINQCVYFICWEGAMASSESFLSPVVEFDTPVATEKLNSLVLPLYPFQTKQSELKDSGIREETEEAEELHLKIPNAHELPTSLKSPAETFSTLDDIVVNALDSISNINFRDADSNVSFGSSFRRKSALTANEKSVRLLEQCNSWNMLDDDQTLLDDNIPVVLARLGGVQDIGMFSLRNMVVRGKAATPFHHVLAWLSHEQDYFTAASIALSLLRDVDSLRDLRKLSADIDFDADRASLEGLLDGIIPLYPRTNDDNEPLRQPKQAILTQVADVTVGCLVKGGLLMSVPLESFLQRNKDYDPAKACLMLVAVATRCVSGESDTVIAAMGQGYKYVGNSTDPSDLLWAIKALVLVGVFRSCTTSVLVLINAAMADELRMRRRGGNLNEPYPPAELCTALVSIIVETSPEAVILLLSLIDEGSQKRFWASLEHRTQLEYSLICADKKYPLLHQPEVRCWTLDSLKYCIEHKVPKSVEVLEVMPTRWLKGLAIACLCNAGCKFHSYCFDHPVQLVYGKDDFDGSQRHASEVTASILAMLPGRSFGGIDFNLLIPCLLLLELRGEQWHEDATLSTQTMINAACNLAGRLSKEEPLFVFDGSILMKQCALAGNVLAGANLIGGLDGLVLKCCDILMKGTDLTMDEAESYVIDDILHGAKDGSSTALEVTDEHRKVLWLLDEHVLSVRTFGEFNPIAVRGKVDPIFAARACLRTWVRLNCSSESTLWLVAWFRRRLGVVNGAVSHKRLSCAVLVRALMWPPIDDPTKEIEPDSDQLLANILGIESSFLVQLCRSCCGLVEAVPPSMAEEIIRQSEDMLTAKQSTHTRVRLDTGSRVM